MRDPWNLPTLTLDLVDVPLTTALEMIADELGIGMIAPGAKDERVTLRVDDADAETVLRSLAARLELVPEYRDGVLSFAQGTDKDGYIWLDGSYARQDQVVSALKNVAGAEVSALGDRYVISGKRDALTLASRLVADLQQGPDGWLLEVRLYQVGSNVRRTLGLDANVTLYARAGLDAGVGHESGLTPVAGLLTRLMVEATGQYRSTDDAVELLTVGTLYLLEGHQATLRQGSVVPIPRRTVSDQGTVTTTGHDYMSVGLTMEVEGRRVPDGLLLTIRPTLSSIAGYVEGLPIRDERSILGTVVVDSGQTVLLSGLDSATHTEGTSGIPGAGLLGRQSTKFTDRSSILVTITATRVYASGASAAQP